MYSGGIDIEETAGDGRNKAKNARNVKHSIQTAQRWDIEIITSRAIASTTQHGGSSRAEYFATSTYEKQVAIFQSFTRRISILV